MGYCGNVIFSSLNAFGASAPFSIDNCLLDSELPFPSPYLNPYFHLENILITPPQTQTNKLIKPKHTQILMNEIQPYKNETTINTKNKTHQRNKH